MELPDLPAVDMLARRLVQQPGLSSLPVPLVTEIAREAIDRARAEISSGNEVDPLQNATALLTSLSRHRPRRVINATGVLLHTNLGRAPIATAAAGDGADFGSGYGNVELDLTTGIRGTRGAYVTTLLRSLTGAEAALIVNNNAAGLFLSLAALAEGRGAIVSRGELVEIGGSFRLPDLMSASGALLIEVGTTNRTHRHDYETAASNAALILKVHPSNYRIEGFAEEVGYRDLATVAAAHTIPFVADIGSGLLDTRVPWLNGPPPTWIKDEPGVRQTLEYGADLVLFSGDKLLGGPQAGIAVGRADLIDRMRQHPIARAVRIDGTTMAALATTLRMYASGEGHKIPFWRMASLSAEELEQRISTLISASGVRGDIVAGQSLLGAGSIPGATIPTPNLELRVPPDAAWEALVKASPPIITRRQGHALRLDLRTVDPADDKLVAAALKTVAERT